MADRDHPSSNIRRFNRREEEGIIAVAETSDSSFDDIVDAITTLRKGKQLSWNTDILDPSRLALCSNCQALATRLKESDSRRKRPKAFDWKAHPIRPTDAAHFSPASPLVTPGMPLSPTTPNEPGMESPVDYFMHLVATAVKDRNQNALIQLVQINLLNLPVDMQHVYSKVQTQLQDRFHRFQKTSEDRLTRYCKKMISKQDTGDIWSSFIPFVKDYLMFLRDFTATDDNRKQNQAGARLTALRESLALVLVAQG